MSHITCNKGGLKPILMGRFLSRSHTCLYGHKYTTSPQWQQDFLPFYHTVRRYFAPSREAFLLESRLQMRSRYRYPWHPTAAFTGSAATCNTCHLCTSLGCTATKQMPAGINNPTLCLPPHRTSTHTPGRRSNAEMNSDLFHPCTSKPGDSLPNIDKGLFQGLHPL